MLLAGLGRHWWVVTKLMGHQHALLPCACSLGPSLHLAEGKAWDPHYSQRTFLGHVHRVVLRW